MKALMHEYNIKCRDCGKFISRRNISEGRAKFKHVPLSELGPEESYWLCVRCSGERT